LSKANEKRASARPADALHDAEKKQLPGPGSECSANTRSAPAASARSAWASNTTEMAKLSGSHRRMRQSPEVQRAPPAATNVGNQFTGELGADKRSELDTETQQPTRRYRPLHELGLLYRRIARNVALHVRHRELRAGRTDKVESKIAFSAICNDAAECTASVVTGGLTL
jgi:hypothetical protein